jgi:hypothetical protein
MAGKPKPLHSKLGPLPADALYDEVPCRKVTLSPETAERDRKMIEDHLKEMGGQKKPA